MKFQYARTLAKNLVVSKNEVALAEGRKEKRAQAKAALAAGRRNFTEVKAPFDGIVDRLLQREGTLIKEGEVLTTLSDNRVMWVYFNVPEKDYLEYMAAKKQHEQEDKIRLMLANGDIFPQIGTIGAIEAEFNNQNGNIKFRADYRTRTACCSTGRPAPSTPSARRSITMMRPTRRSSRPWPRSLRRVA